ncbi:MAG: Triosephosphate isomerase, partial [Bacteroidota bacterium]
MKILAGNWKMNTTFEEGYTLIEALKTELSPERLGDVVVVVA